MSTLPQRRAARKHAEKTEKTAKLGSGARFKAIERSAKLGGAKNPAGVAAAVAAKKYGSKKLHAMAGKGRHKAAVKRHGGK